MESIFTDPQQTFFWKYLVNYALEQASLALFWQRDGANWRMSYFNLRVM